MLRTALLFACVFGVLIMPGRWLLAQDYPSKAIRIVTAAAGGGSDFTARQIAQGLSNAWGQPVIVENRPQGVLAAEAVSKAPSDGYTLLVAGGVLWVYPLLRKASYDVTRDFLPVTMTERTVHIVAVHPSMPVKSVKELIALARGRPGELNYGSGGTGSSQHLAAEQLKSMAGVDIAHVPYKGGAAAITALLSGEVQLTIFETAVLSPHVNSGRLKALAVTSADPSRLAPGLPTVSASGLPGYESVGMTGVFAPAKTPMAIVDRLHQEIVRFLNTAEVKERLFSIGVETVGSSPQQFAAAIRSDVARLAKVIRDAGIKTE